MALAQPLHRSLNVLRVDCGACNHVAMPTLAALLKNRAAPRGEGSRPQRAGQKSQVRSEAKSGRVAQ